MSVADSSPEIVNGKVVKPKDIARGGFANSVVRLYVDDNLCTGTVIAPTLVLTAGHCVVSAWDTLHSYIAFQIINANVDAPESHLIRVAKFLVHPDYTDDSTSLNLGAMTNESKSDIALALLAEPVPASVRPASLPSADFNIQNVKSVTAAGYGNTKKNSKGVSGRGYLRFTAFPKKDLKMTNGMIVATDEKTGVCEGDSGGPLFAGSGRSTKNMVVGVSDFTMPVPNTLLKRISYQWTAVYRDNFKAYTEAHPDDELCIGHNGFVDVASHRAWIIQAAGEMGISLSEK